MTTPLSIAIQKGHIDAARMLVNAGAFVNTPNLHDHTPLHEALVIGKTSFAFFLLKHGARMYESSLLAVCEGNDLAWNSFRGQLWFMVEDIYAESHALAVRQMCVGTDGRVLIPELVDIVAQYASPATWEDVRAYVFIDDEG